MMNAYKQIVLSFFFMIVVTGCANVTTNVPLSSPTAAAGETTPTPKPTDIPPTPTETRDPNMPPGATGKDAQGNYIKTVTENGKTFSYTWNIESNEWQRELTSGLFPLLDYSKSVNDAGIPDSAYLHVLVADNAIGSGALQYLKHPTADEDSIHHNVASLLRTLLMHATGLDSRTFDEGVRDGGVVFIKITTHTGEHTLFFDRNTQIDITLDNFDAMKPTADNGMSEWKNPDGGRTYRSVVEVDDVHNRLIGRISVNDSLANLSQHDLVEMILANLAMSMDNPNQTKQFFTSSVNEMAFFAFHGIPQTFTFSNTP